MTHPDSGTPQAVPPLCPRSTVSNQDGIWALVFRDRERITDERMLRPFIWLNFSLNYQPLAYIFLLLIKRVSLKWNVRRSLKVHNPLSSQIAGHLNTVPIGIQSLSLLIGSGSDREHQCRLFRFQKWGLYFMLLLSQYTVITEIWTVLRSWCYLTEIMDIYAYKNQNAKCGLLVYTLEIC